MTTREALEGCPFCEGLGAVPTSSGLTDADCLCLVLDYVGRLLTAGRLEYAGRCERNAVTMREGGDATGADAYVSIAAAKREQAAHIIYGCPYGRCTGNSDHGRCVAPTCDACDRLIPDALERSSNDELTICVRCY